jgi:hypothetical protein
VKTEVNRACKAIALSSGESLPADVLKRKKYSPPKATSFGVCWETAGATKATKTDTINHPLHRMPSLTSFKTRLKHSVDTTVKNDATF